MSKKYFFLLATFMVLASYLFGGCSFFEQKPKMHIVEIKNMKFVPEIVVVRLGDTVEWVNKDMVLHDVTEKVGHAWTSSPMESGETWSLVVRDSFQYYCSLHVVMKGEIQVR